MRVRRIWHPDRRPGLGRTAREFIWITLGQAAAALGSIIGVRLLTSFLPPVEYGTLALGLTVVTLAQQTILSPLSGAALRFWAPAQEANDLNAYLAAVGILVKQSAVVVGIAALGTILTLILLGYSGWATLCVASFFFTLASGYSATLDGMQNAARQRILVAWHEGVAPWLRFLAAIGVIQIAGASGSSAMFGYGAASLMVLVSQYGFLRYRMSSLAFEAAASLRQATPWLKEMRAYGWPFAAWGAFTWAQMVSDRWSLQAFATTRDVGLYAVLFQLSYYPITIVSGLLTQLMTPILFAWAGDASDAIRTARVRHVNNWIVRAVLLLTVAGAVLTYLAHRPLFAILAAPQYYSVSWLMPWMVLSAGLYTAGQVALLSVLSSTDTRRLIAPKIATSLVGMCFNVLGAFHLGIQGVVVAGVFFSFLHLMWSYRLARSVAVPRQPEESQRGGNLT